MTKITRKQAEERLALPVLSFEEAIKKLDKSYTLIYTDYRDVIEDPKIFKEIIENGYPEYDFIDSYGEWQWESANQIMKELFSDVDIEDIEDDVRIAIMERDDSDPLGETIRRTGEFVAYYELGEETYGIYGDPKEDMQTILKLLKTNKKHPSYKELTEILAEASYGGNICFMFCSDLSAFYGNPDKDPKYIIFTDPTIAIMDRFNGSGDFVQIKGTYTLPFDRTKIKSDDAESGYSLIGQVFGTGRDAVDCHWNLSDIPEGKILEIND